MNTSDELSLKEIEIQGLFCVFNYVIPLSQVANTTIIFGKNGTGKTTILRMLNSISEIDLQSLVDIPFEKVTLDFGRHKLLVKNLEFFNEETDEGMDALIKFQYEPEKKSELLDELIEKYGESFSCEFKFNALEIEALAQDWFRRKKSHYRTEAIRERYENLERKIVYVPDGERRIPLERKRLDYLREKMNQLEILIKGLGFQCEYISAQRLKTKDRRDETVLSVVKHSREMARRIQGVFHGYSRRGSQTSQTFPMRVMKRAGVDLENVALSNELSKLEESRNELADLGLLPERSEDQDTTFGEDDTIDSQDGEEKFRSVFLRIYIDDEKEKIQHYDNLRKRTKLFLEFVNDRLYRKRLHISFRKTRRYRHPSEEYAGAFVINDEDGREISLADLSSGEQHLITWSYRLIFTVGDNKIVLMDEPELSMHIEWQLKFVKSIERISRERNLRFILATHSPAIVKERRDITARLDAESSGNVG